MTLNLFGQDGEPIELDDVQRINLICFNCTKYIEDNFGMLVLPMDEQSSDNVGTRQTVNLCQDCCHKVMKFMGSVNE